MAPEMLKGEGILFILVSSTDSLEAYSTPADVYGFGVVLWVRFLFLFIFF